MTVLLLDNDGIVSNVKFMMDGAIYTFPGKFKNEPNS
jgi:hypothetical protein